MRRVSPQEADELMQTEGYVYVDVRSIPEFEAGHPRGAFNVPLLHSGSGPAGSTAGPAAGSAGPAGMAANPDFLRVMLARFSKRQKLVLGCQAGIRSLRAAEILVAEGFQLVVDQRAGWGGVRDPFGSTTEAGWLRAGLPAASTAEPGHSYADLCGDLE